MARPGQFFAGLVQVLADKSYADVTIGWHADAASLPYGCDRDWPVTPPPDAF